MLSQAIACRGDFYSMGLDHGEGLRPQVFYNLAAFWKGVRARGWRREEVLAQALAREKEFPSHRLEEVAGIARGAGREFPELLAFNLFSSLVFPEECTVMIALPDATASGKTLFLKNSDKIGSHDMVGPGFYQHKEINVVVLLRPEGSPAILGVAAAGSTGLKMGVNDKGVAVGTNIARTVELARKAISTEQWRALDRTQLARDGLEAATALEASQRVASKVLAQPTSTPGNLEFADAREAVILESSYDRVALQRVTSGTVSRSNCFILLRELNNPEDLSSQCRYVRTQQLLRQPAAALTFEAFMRFSMDHENGPGPNSICRHGSHYTEETSQSALVAEIPKEAPENTRVAIALGKPCHAWRRPEGHLVLDLRAREEDIPHGFRNGEVWKQFWTEKPYS